MKREDKFESACTVWFGTFSPDDLDTMPMGRTPEDELISKELLEGKDMPGELRYIIKTIANLPEEFFLSNGRLSRTMMVEEIRLRMGKTKAEVQELLWKIRKRIEG